MSIEIVAWSETFENKDSRKLVDLKWYAVPVGRHSRGYIRLMAMGERGLAAMGLFSAICQEFATRRKEQRSGGIFTGRDGELIPISEICEAMRIPESIALPYLDALEAVKWIIRHDKKAETQLEFGQSAANPPQISRDLPPHTYIQDKQTYIGHDGHGRDMVKGLVVHQRGAPSGEVLAAIGRLAESANFDGAKSFHIALAAELIATGLPAKIEYPVADRGDGREGFVDIVVTQPDGTLCAIECDNRTARDKSIFKVNLPEFAAGIVLVRNPAENETQPDAKKPRKTRETSLPDGFCQFWQIYPRKVAKPRALAAWKAQKCEPIADLICEAVERNAKANPQWLGDKQYIPHPASWLNARQWEDAFDAVPIARSTLSQEPEGWRAAFEQVLLREEFDRSKWPDKFADLGRVEWSSVQAWRGEIFKQLKKGNL